MKTRRFFWGNALPQALMAAARYHGLPPDELAYRIYDKRHGFVHRTRRLIIEVDPAAPRRAPGAQPASRTSPESRTSPAPPPPPASLSPQAPLAPNTARSSRAASTPERSAPPSSPTHPQPESPAPDRRFVGPTPSRPAPQAAAAPPRAPAVPHLEPFLPPDEESELAATVAVGRLLTLAGLELAVRVERQPDRLIVTLGGPDEERLRELGEEFLDDLEHLLPRAIRGLAGRLVRCTVDGAGLRVAREDELRKLAEQAADHVAASGQAVLLEPLPAADRRIVHLALHEDPRVTTESQGFGAEKRIRISPAGSPASD